MAQQTDWRSITTFVISLQSRQVGGQTEQRTTAYCLEADRSIVWPRVESEAVYQLIRDQLHQVLLQPEVAIQMEPEAQNQSESTAAKRARPQKKSASPEPAQPSDSSAPPQPLSPVNPEAACPDAEVSSPIALDIIQLKFWQPPQSMQSLEDIKQEDIEQDADEQALIVNLAKRSLPGSLQLAEPFDLEITFQITGEGVTTLTREQLSGHSEFYVRDYTRGQSLTLGRSTTQPLEQAELTYTSRLAHATLQKPGPYRFQIVTKLDNGLANPIFFELPFVQVV